jgi:hypothetical protein
MQLNKIITLYLFIIVCNISYGQNNKFWFQLSPQILIINHPNIKVIENTNYPNNNPVISHKNPYVRIGLYYILHIKDNFYLRPGITFSNFNIKLNHFLSDSNFSTTFWSTTHFFVYDLSLSIIKTNVIFKKSILILEAGAGYCQIFKYSEQSFFDNPPYINTTLEENGDITKITLGAHFGVRYLDPRFLKGKFEFGLSYHLIFGQLPYTEIIETANTQRIHYKVSPGISLLSFDLNYNLSRDKNKKK